MTIINIDEEIITGNGVATLLSTDSSREHSENNADGIPSKRMVSKPSRFQVLRVAEGLTPDPDGDSATEVEPCLENEAHVPEFADILDDVEVDDGSRDVSVEIDNDRDTSRDGLPIDRGWAWVITAAATMMHVIIFGIMKCFGIFFVQYQMRFKTSSSMTSLIFTIHDATYSITSLLLMTLGESLSVRFLVMAGTVVSTIAYLVAAYVTNIYVIYIALGLVDGACLAAIHPPMVALLSSYFDKRVGLANTLCNAGVPIGGLALAPLFTTLFDYYGFTGTHIIVAGLQFNILIVGALMRPLEFYKRQNVRKNSKGNTQQQNSDTDKFNSTKNGMYSKQANGHTHSSRHHGYEENKNSNDCFVDGVCVDGDAVSEMKSNGVSRPLLSKTVCRRNVNKGNKTEHNGSNHADQNVFSPMNSFFNSKANRFGGSGVLVGSMVDISCQQHFKATNTSLSGLSYTSKGTTSSSRPGIKHSIQKTLSKLLDIKLLRRPLFIYFLVCNSFLCAGNALIGAFLVPHAVDVGVHHDQLAWLVSAPCIAELTFKLFLGYLSDKVPRSTFMGWTAVIMGILCHLMPLATTFPVIMVIVCIVGILNGVYFSLFVVLIIDILSMDAMKVSGFGDRSTFISRFWLGYVPTRMTSRHCARSKGALGFTCLIQGLSVAITLPIAGYIRDETGHYFLSYNFIGTLLFIGAALCLLMPAVQRRLEGGRDDKNKSSSAEEVAMVT